MAYFLFKCWHEQLFRAERASIIPQKSNLSLEFVSVTEYNAHLVAELRGQEFEGQFRTQLSLGDFGYYAYLDGKPVGYGWAKHTGSDDYFFKIGEGCAYLCRFFVHESARGHGIYPALISALIEREAQVNRFYIAAERGNDASVRGLRKVGFEFVKEFGFVRGFKHTFNKRHLHL